ncbi:copper amine oxidase [Dendrosporobacter sp. 1207_IL3150]|uniref:copper amine oxidase n=1 Tax=Dendrosporobacter sp. 1207_IL3150 TaxID=3084054 RepID=UPI002FD9E42A
MNWLRKIMPVLLLASIISSTVFASEYKLQGKDVLDLPEWPVTSSSYGGKLLLSDSPEMVPDIGITYQDTVSGNVRLFFHHVNDTKEPKKIVVLLENKGNETAHVTVSRFGLGGPNLDYLLVGKDAQMQYLKGNNLYLLEVYQQSSRILDTSLSEKIVQPNELVHGIYDFISDKPVNVKVMMMPVNEDIEKFAAEAKVLPADQHRLRGTFEGKDRMIVGQKVFNGQKDNMSVVTLADNVIDRYVTGIDATDGSEVINYGNYGIVYKMFLPTTYNGKIGYYLNPRGGVYAGGIGLKYRHQNEFALETPSNSLFFGENKITDIERLGVFDGGQSLWFTFSPPGASNLPVKLVLVPQ